MLYLAIDQHRKQLTIQVRQESGAVIERRQVSTRWEKVREFFQALSITAGEEGFVAIVEVCGFNDWLLARLREYGCREVVVVQPTARSLHKTDRRDAQELGDLLWVNRARLVAGEPVVGLRRVRWPTPAVAAARQLAALRRRLGQFRTRTLNKLQRILLKHNLQQECPTKTIQTGRARIWLAELALPAIDRLEVDLLLAQWQVWEEQLQTVERRIAEAVAAEPTAAVLATTPGLGAFGSLALAAHMDRIERFAHPGSLANYWGLTPRCRNSGERTDRLGSITKQGSSLARFILGQLVLHILKRDPAMRCWYLRIKRRRGAKIARVAVMRRLTTILWHMVKHREPYACGGPPRRRRSSPPALPRCAPVAC